MNDKPEDNRQNGKDPSISLDLDLNQSIQKAVDPHGAASSNIILDLDFDPDLWKINIDSAQIQQIINSIQTSAAKAMEAGGTMSVSTRNIYWDADSLKSACLDLKPGPYVHLSIRDSATCGESCDIYLPAIQKGMESREKSAAGAAQSLGTVLIIDDEESVIAVTRRILERKGYQVLSAQDGEKAVQLANSHPEPIHAALLDIGMPVMNGVEAYPLLVKARPGMKIIICTGFEPSNELQPFRKAGAFSFLQKPYRAEILINEIRKAIDAANGSS